MAKTVEKENSYDDGSYVVKKSRKHNILAFIVCVLVAFAIWLYATNKENEKLLEERAETSAQSTEASASSDA